MKERVIFWEGFPLEILGKIFNKSIYNYMPFDPTQFVIEGDSIYRNENGHEIGLNKMGIICDDKGDSSFVDKGFLQSLIVVWCITNQVTVGDLLNYVMDSRFNDEEVADVLDVAVLELYKMEMDFVPTKSLMSGVQFPNSHQVISRMEAAITAEYELYGKGYPDQIDRVLNTASAPPYPESKFIGKGNKVIPADFGEVVNDIVSDMSKMNLDNVEGIDRGGSAGKMLGSKIDLIHQVSEASTVSADGSGTPKVSTHSLESRMLGVHDAKNLFSTDRS